MIQKKKVLNIEMAGNIEYNGINCRNRTAFEDKLGRKIYVEFDAGHSAIKTNKPGNVYFHLTHLFRIDIAKDRLANHTLAFDDLIDEINRKRLPYTQETINTVLRQLGLPESVEAVAYCTNKTYRVHHGATGFILGN